MLRKFLLPALAAATLAGCVTGYGYRAGSGDYYYGKPQAEYRYYGGYGGYSPYGYGSYYGGGYYLGMGYGFYPYGSGAWWPRYYGYPYGYRYRPPHHHGHHGDHEDDDAQTTGPGGQRYSGIPPWRNIGNLPPREPSRLRNMPPPGGGPGPMLRGNPGDGSRSRAVMPRSQGIPARPATRSAPAARSPARSAPARMPSPARPDRRSD